MALLAFTCHCKAIQALRHKLKQAASETIPQSKAGLKVTVTPEVGISIWLDGEKVSHTSPYTHTHLKPGPHMLEVRGMGYHTLRLPLSLQAGQWLDVPVALRLRN